LSDLLNASDAVDNITRAILGKSLKKKIRSLEDLLMSNDEMREIKAQQDELSRKLNEKISGDLSKFQKTMDDIFKQKQISQREYFIQKIKEEQEHADSNIKSGDLMSAMAHKLTADWYSSMLIITTH
jgi:hypothetical protein